jgi:hypothetical protein
MIILKAIFSELSEWLILLVIFALLALLMKYAEYFIPLAALVLFGFGVYNKAKKTQKKVRL